MKKIIIILTAASLSIGVGVANFAEAAPYYVAFNGGMSRLKNFCANPANGFSCKDSAFAYTLDGGYQFSDRFGLELGYANYGSPQTSGPVSGSNLEVTQEISGFRFSGTASFPVSSSFALTGKLGFANTYLNVTSKVNPGPVIPSYSVSTTSFSYGAGIQYAINKSTALRVQYENMGKIGDETIGTDTLSLLTVGASYNFDLPRPRAIKSKSAIPAAAQTEPTTIRVIVYLKQSAASGRLQLTAAIAEACQCQPVFVRLSASDAAIYQIDLAPGQTFSSFAGALLPGDAALGIRLVEQDRLKQIQ
ncbi:MAG TPA: outer membrane beta-barrel protein [Gallionellaceae bacterium]|nr:outer membrane beta-barrel protein [Gallionellaceae bacterium]